MSLAPVGVPALPERHDARPDRPDAGSAATASCCRAGTRRSRSTSSSTSPATASSSTTSRRCAPGARRPRATPRSTTPPASRSRPARSAPGLASAVGMAMAQRRQRGLLDPDASPGRAPFDHHVCVLASDGDLQEGVTAEASLARRPPGARQPHRRLRRQPDLDRGRHRHLVQRGRRQRYAAYGWHVVDIDWRDSTTRTARATTRTSTRCSRAARRRAKAETKPTLVRLHTIIAWPAPTQAEHRQVARLRARRGRGRRHQVAARLRPREVLRRRPRGPRPHPQGRERGKAAHQAWNSGSRHGARPTPSAPRCSTASSTAACPRAGTTPCRPSADAKGLGHSRSLRQGAHRPRRRAARAVGRLGRPRRVQQHDDGRRALVPPQPQADPRRGRATPTGAPCTSASASTAWA